GGGERAGGAAAAPSFGESRDGGVRVRGRPVDGGARGRAGATAYRDARWGGRRVFLARRFEGGVHGDGWRQHRRVRGGGGGWRAEATNVASGVGPCAGMDSRRQAGHFRVGAQ